MSRGASKITPLCSIAKRSIRQFSHSETSIVLWNDEILIHLSELCWRLGHKTKQNKYDIFRDITFSRGYAVLPQVAHLSCVPENMPAALLGDLVWNSTFQIRLTEKRDKTHIDRGSLYGTDQLRSQLLRRRFRGWKKQNQGSGHIW